MAAVHELPSGSGFLGGQVVKAMKRTVLLAKAFRARVGRHVRAGVGSGEGSAVFEVADHPRFGVAQQRCVGRKRLEVSRGEKGQRFCVDPSDRRGENRLGCAS